MVPEDIHEVTELFARLSDESVRNRFHGQRRATADDLRFVNVDYTDRFGLVAETSRGDDRSVVALTSYVPAELHSAEMAIVVDATFH